MRTVRGNHRAELLEGLWRFLDAVHRMAGVQRIALVGSITTDKPNPKDIDLLVNVTDSMDLAPLATAARRLQGHAQRVNCGADVFLADVDDTYIGRACHWKECRPGIRLSCDALHCGKRPHLHDDFDAVRLDETLLKSPPVIVWPEMVRRCELPDDLERVLARWVQTERR